MPNKIKPRRSYTANSVPLTSDLETNELAINWTDGKAFTKDAAGNIVSLTLGGGGGGSSQDTALRAFFVPPAPTSVTATGGNAQATVSWTAPTVLTQTPITDYVVQYSSNGGSTWTTFSDGTSTETSATVTGLTNGTAYTFKVAAVNGIGTGNYSTASSGVTPSDASFIAIPAMTSYNTPSGEVTYVSTLESSGMAAWQAFDNNSGTSAYFLRSSFNNPLRMLQYAFPSNQKSRISGYSIAFSFPGYGTAFTQWKVYGSDDLSTWTLIDSRSGQSFSSAGPTSGSFSLAAIANYRAYRWVFQDESDLGGDNLIGAIQLTA